MIRVVKAGNKPERECVSCLKLTKYICIDCAVDEKGFIPLCLDVNCRDKHQALHTVRDENVKEAKA